MNVLSELNIHHGSRLLLSSYKDFIGFRKSYEKDKIAFKNHHSAAFQVHIMPQCFNENVDQTVD